jgi:predicted transcriptional regulator
MPAPIRINVTLEPETAERLARMARWAHVPEGTMARMLISRAVDDNEAAPAHVAAIIGAIPGAWDDVRRGLAEYDRGEAVDIDDL